MILLAHLLLGAVVGNYIKNVPLAILLALLCHYALDTIPHVEYSIKNLEEKNWKKSLPDFLKVFLDFSFGMALIALFSKNQPLIYICAIVAILPDATTLLGWIVPGKLLRLHYRFHEKLHYFKYKKIPAFWRIFTQVATVIICVLLLHR